MKQDQIFEAIANLPLDEVPSVFADALRRLIEEGGQTSLREGLRAADSLCDYSVGELESAIEQWNQEGQ